MDKNGDGEKSMQWLHRSVQWFHTYLEGYEKGRTFAPKTTGRNRQ